MVEAASRKRSQPAPPWVLFEALTDPNRDPSRPWLVLLEGEVLPKVLEINHPDLVVWSSLWNHRPDASIRFDLPVGAGGTILQWTLFVEEPIPDVEEVRQMRRRINKLVNDNLRQTFDQ